MGLLNGLWLPMIMILIELDELPGIFAPMAVRPYEVRMSYTP